MQFLRAYSSITIELARLLDVRFVPGDEAHLGHTGAALARVMLLNNKGDHLRRDWELNRLMLLINDLQLLEKRRHDLFLLFRTKLQDPDVHRYFGSRHELGTAVAFLERDIPFKFELPARPDFVIDEAPDAAGIECTSSHLTQIKSVDLAYKVQSTLHAKAAKPYANSNTALSVEATSLQSVALRDNKLVFGFESDSAIADIASRSPFGSLVMMATIINEDADPAQIQRTYTRFDNGPSSQLSGLLDGLFPVGHEVDLHNYSFFPMP